MNDTEFIRFIGIFVCLTVLLCIIVIYIQRDTLYECYSNLKICNTQNRYNEDEENI